MNTTPVSGSIKAANVQMSKLLDCVENKNSAELKEGSSLLRMDALRSFYFLVILCLVIPVVEAVNRTTLRLCKILKKWQFWVK